jgi:hypothetical protein
MVLDFITLSMPDNFVRLVNLVVCVNSIEILPRIKSGAGTTTLLRMTPLEIAFLTGPLVALPAVLRTTGHGEIFDTQDDIPGFRIGVRNDTRNFSTSLEE